MGHDSTASGDSTTAGDSGSDSAAATDSNASDSTSAGDSSSTDTGAADSSDGGLPDGGDSVVATISLTGQPTALAIDSTHNRLYVALSDGLGDNLGFAIVDTSTDTVTATIPAPTVDSGSGPFPFETLALDPTANLLYASDLNATPLVYVFDVTADTFKNRFSIVGTGITAPWISSLAVNPATSTLYVGAYESSGGGSKVAVINTTNDSLTAAITLADLYVGGVSSLGLDTTNGLLFACSNGPVNLTPATKVDAIDTTTNLETGTQQSLAGASLGCLGGTGFAVDVTANGSDPDGGVAGYFYSLEPFTIRLPSGFVPTAYTSKIGQWSGQVLVLGYDGVSGNPEYLYVDYPHEDSGVIATHTPAQPQTYLPKGARWIAVEQNADDFYATLDVFSDAGTSPAKAVYHLHIPALGDAGDQ